MKKKTILLLAGLLVAGGAVYAFTRKKPEAPKKRTATVFAGDTQSTDEYGTEVLKMGEEGEAVTRLQRLINAYHVVRTHLLTVCGKTSTKVFKGFAPDASGKLIAETGVFDYQTKELVLFYFGKAELTGAELDRNERLIDQWHAATDEHKCGMDPLIAGAVFTGISLSNLFK